MSLVHLLPVGWVRFQDTEIISRRGQPLFRFNGG